ncbi:dimethylarginine dimethylaminohydrolase family protein [Gemmatimonadota bacterium]
MNDPSAAAYGGPGWSPRTSRLLDEIGSVWSKLAVVSEYSPLTAVLLHRPGQELSQLSEPDDAQMLSLPDTETVTSQHDLLAKAYRNESVAVHYVEPATLPTPNQMFVADLMFMTPTGAILGRPASTVRAGEERWVARRLADLGIPILRSVAGAGTFEGADAAWLDPGTVLLGRGLRTNAEGAAQVAATLDELGVTTIVVDLPHSVMHLMGSLRIVDRDLAFVRLGGAPWTAMEALQNSGYDVKIFPDEEETRTGMAHNFVTLARRKILMPAGNPRTEQALNEAGITTVVVDVSEITKAAGAIGCLTGVLAREADKP